MRPGPHDDHERNSAAHGARFVKVALGIDLFLMAWLASDLVLDPKAFTPLPLLLLGAIAIILVARLRFRRQPEDAVAQETP